MLGGRGQLHAVSEAGPLVVIIGSPSAESDAPEGTDIVEPRYPRKSVSVRVRRRDALVMARVALQDVAVDRLWLHVMQLRGDVALVKRALILESRPTSRVQAALSSVDLNHLVLVDLVLMDRLRNVASASTGGSVMKAHSLVA